LRTENITNPTNLTQSRFDSLACPAIPASKKHLRKQVLFATKSAVGGRNPPAVDEIASR